MSQEKIKSMVDNIVNGNNLESESDFKSVMSDKVGETLEKERQTIAKDMVTSHIPEEGTMRFDNFYSKIVEKDEHKRSKEYKKLTPKMKKAVDEIFNKMDSNSSDFINSFENNINLVSKKHKVTNKELMNYFEREMLTIGK